MELLSEKTTEQLVEMSQMLALDQEAIRERRRAIRQEIDRRIEDERKQREMQDELKRLQAAGLQLPANVEG